MDLELRQFLEGMETRLRSDVQESEGRLRGEMQALRGEMQELEGRLRGEMQELEKRLLAEIRQGDRHLSALIEGVSESLHRELQTGLDQIRQMQLRLDRQGGMLAAGSRWIARMDTWSERTDQSVESWVLRLHALEERVRKLEGGAAA